MANPKLYILSEQFGNQSYELTDEEYNVGRIEGNDIQIVDPTISGRHCLISRLPNGSYSITDLNSTNGTSVNETRVTSEPVVLHNGDMLMFGSVELMFENKEAATPTKMRTTAVINLNDANNVGEDAKQYVTEMKNLGNRVNPHSSMDLRSRQRQNKMIQIVIGVLALLAIGIAAICIINTLRR